MDARRFILFCVVWWCSLNPFIYVAEGRYELQVMLRGYDNPDQKCEFCHTRCCDIKQSVPCTNNSRCDTTFFYCLRTYEARGRNCSYSGSVESSRNRNDASLDFSLPRVLGLDNPLSLEGLTDTWNCVQLYIEARDKDLDGTYELIDYFEIDHNSPVGVNSEQTFSSFYDNMKIDLTVTVRCEPGYTGTMCENNINDCTEDSCNRNGHCIDGVNTFTCDCYAGFMGINCATNINECIGINCSGSGLCRDGNNSFTCDCDSGYTGDHCEVDIDDCIGKNCSEHGVCVDGVANSLCICDSGYTGRDCETDLDECRAVNCSGRGQCVVNVDTLSLTCNCDEGYQGSLCEATVDRCTSNLCSEEAQGGNNLVAPIVGGVLGAIISLLIILLTALIIVLVRWRKRHRKLVITSRNGHTDYTSTASTHIYDDSGTFTDSSLGGLLGTVTSGSVAINQPNNSTNQEIAESAVDLEREFDNPIYGDNGEADVYTEITNKMTGKGNSREIGSTPDRVFVNPIYGDETDVNMYSIQVESNTCTGESGFVKVTCAESTGQKLVYGNLDFDGQNPTNTCEHDYDYVDH